MKRLYFFICTLILLLSSFFSVSAEERIRYDDFVYVTDVADFQSQHPYGESIDNVWVYTHNTEAKCMYVTFSRDTYVEEDFDFIFVYDKNDNIIGEYTGNELSGKTLFVDGNVIKVRIKSDESDCEYGFSVSKIVAEATSGPIQRLKSVAFERDHIVLEFPEINDADKVILEQSTDGNTWIPSKVEGEMTPTATTVKAVELVSNTKYWFRLNVIGGSCSGISNIVEVRTKPYYSIDADFYISSDGSISDYYGNESYIHIPPTIKGIPVTSISSYAFENCSAIHIELPDSVTSIGKSAFANCTALKEIILGTNITEIKEDAFKNCTSLEKINWNCINVNSYKFAFTGSGSVQNGVEVIFGDTVEVIPAKALSTGGSNGINTLITSLVLGDNVKFIGENAFSYCTSIKEITLPESINKIESYAFNQCISVETIYWNSAEITGILQNNGGIFSNAGSNGEVGTTVIFGDKVKSIPYSAFYKMKYLKKVIMPDSVEKIGGYAFFYCENLDSIYVSNNITAIENYTFAYCKSLVSVSGGKQIESLANNAFAYCESLVSLDDMKNVVTVGEKVFYECTSLERIPFWSGITSMGKSAFENCTSLKEIVINDKFTTLPEFVFSGCKGLEKLIICAELEDFTNKNHAFSSCGIDSTGIKVMFTENIKHIPMYLFYGEYYKSGTTKYNFVSPNISSVYLGNSVKTIGKYAFKLCQNLKVVEGGKSVTEIMEMAFDSCYSLAEVPYFESLVEIGGEAFRHCVPITEFKFPKSLRHIGAGAFISCSLNEIIIPEGVESIKAWAFESCDKAKLVSVPKTVTELGYRVFMNCSSIEKIYWNTDETGEDIFGGSYKSSFELYIGDDIYEIKNGVFNGSKVTKLKIGDKVNKICDQAFSACDYLENVILADSVTYIGDYAFSRCSSLSAINLGNVVYIGDGAFDSCTSLGEIDMSSALYIGNSGFSYCPITKLEGPQLRAIGDRGFYMCQNLESVKLPKIESLGGRTFYNCYKLSSVELSKFLALSGNYEFWGCAELKSIKVYSEGVLDINDFNGCAIDFELNYYSEKYNDMAKEGRLDEFPGMIGQTVIPEKLELSGKEVAMPGDIFAIDKEFSTKNSTECITKWSSMYPSVASVENGIVTCHSVGKTVILAEVNAGVIDSLALTVTNSQLEIISSQPQLLVGTDEKLTVYAKFISRDYSPDTAVWTVKDDSIAKIESEGYTKNGDNSYTLYAVVKGIESGITDIKVSVKEADDECKIQVGAYPDKVANFIVVDRNGGPIEGAW